jgi:acetyl esterase/lipase
MIKPSAILPLWPAAMPGLAPDVTGPEVDQTRPNEDRVAGKRVIRLGNVAKPELHVYLPAGKKPKTGVVVCPGGGHYILAWDLEGTEVATWLNKRGIAVFVLKYRVPTGRHAQPWQGPAMDAQRALRIVRAGNYGIEKLGVLGFSAGGKTAGVAALQNGAALYDPTDAIDRVSCRPDFGCLIYPAYFCDEKNHLLPEWAAKFTKDTPPLFLAHAADDPVTCHSSVGLFAAAQKAGASAELHLWESGGHGYGLRPQKGKPVTTDWPVQCEKWLKQRGL